MCVALRSHVRPLTHTLSLDHTSHSHITHLTLHSTKARFDLHLDELNKQTTKCLMLKKSPIPLVYTRHTSRFLAIWVLLLPLALVGELQGNASWLVVPVSSLVATFFFGIEELGVQLEEPFSVMPLENTMECIEDNIWEMVEAEAALAPV